MLAREYFKCCNANYKEALCLFGQLDPETLDYLKYENRFRQNFAKFYNTNLDYIYYILDVL